MRTDKEGFLYPEVNLSECIDCKLCEKVCPVLHPIASTEEPMVLPVLIMIHKFVCRAHLGVYLP